MEKITGIRVTQPKKDVFSPIKRYEAQLLDTSTSLSEYRRGKAEDVEFEHEGGVQIPLVLKSKILSEKRRGALLPAEVNAKKIKLSGNNFYREFKNKQVQYTYNQQFEPDMIGEYKLVSFSTVPDGWLECDGSIVDRNEYIDLFNLIGEQFGAGDGSTTFQLPDFRDKIPMHFNPSNTDYNAIGKTGGTDSHYHLTPSPVGYIAQSPHFFTNSEFADIVTDYGAHRVSDIQSRKRAPANSVSTGSVEVWNLRSTIEKVLPKYQVGGKWIIKATP